VIDTDKTITDAVRLPLQLPPNWVDMTPERTGTLMVIVGATAANNKARVTDAA
jgi:hypothetical protein